MGPFVLKKEREGGSKSFIKKFPGTGSKYWLLKVSWRVPKCSGIGPGQWGLSWASLVANTLNIWSPMAARRGHHREGQAEAQACPSLPYVAILLFPFATVKLLSRLLCFPESCVIPVDYWPCKGSWSRGHGQARRTFLFLKDSSFVCFCCKALLACSFSLSSF